MESYCGRLVIFLFSLCPASLLAQTGPGGVSTSTNLFFWYDASQEAYSNGGSVSVFTDFSGSGNNANQGNTSNQPVFTTNSVNNLPAFIFDGSNDFLTVNSIAGLNGDNTISWFGIAQSNTSSVAQSIMATNYQGGGANNYKWGMRVGSQRQCFYRRDDGSQVFQGVSYNAAYNLYNGLWNGSTTFSTYINNALAASASSATSTAGTYQITYFGRNSNNNSGYLNGGIAELFVFNFVVNTTQRTLVANYFSTKYNIAITSDKFAFDATHGSNTAGIGQEGATDNNTDAQGSGIVRISGASDLENGEYMLWGDDGGGTGSNGDEVPAEYVAPGGVRLDQEWRVDISGGDGSVGTVDMVFDMTGINFGADPANYQILTDSDGDFSDADVNAGIIASVNGDEITFEDVPLSDGDFFTIGNSNEVAECFSLTTDDWQSVVWGGCGSAPDSSTSVIISDGTEVTIPASSSESAFELTIEGPTGSLVVSSGASLIVKSDFTVDVGASFTFDSDAVLIFRGESVQQTFTNNSGVPITLYDLEINNLNGVVTTGGSFELQNGLTMTNGDLTNSGTFTFLSDASQTAHVNPVPNGSLLDGTFNVQRFVSTRGDWWNDLASPVSTDIEDLDDDIFISGISGADGSAGGFISMWYWDENGSPDEYISPASTAEVMELGRGYETWLADNTTQWIGKAWELSGEIDLNPVSVTVNSADSRWNLLGNPYPAFLDFDNIANNSGGIDNDEWWYYDASTKSYTSGGNTFIPPGQGFWVQTTGITEIDIDPSTDFLSDENSSTFHKTAKEQLQVHLMNQNEEFGSAVYLRKNESAFIGLDEMDVYPLRLPDSRSCHMTIENGASQTMVNYIPTDQSVLEIPLHIESGMAGDFSISLKGLSAFDEYVCVNLVSEETGEQVSMNEQASYRFTVKNPAQPIDFKLVLSKDDYEYCESPVTKSVVTNNIDVFSQGKIVFADFHLDQGANAEIEIYNALGERVYKNHHVVGLSRETIDLNAHNSGVYFVNVMVNGSLTTDKIILQ